MLVPSHDVAPLADQFNITLVGDPGTLEERRSTTGAAIFGGGAAAGAESSAVTLLVVVPPGPIQLTVYVLPGVAPADPAVLPPVEKLLPAHDAAPVADHVTAALVAPKATVGVAADGEAVAPGENAGRYA
jgi:hypothetical protein